MRQPTLIACDFDGTVTRQDTLVAILDAYGSSEWRQVQTQVVSGQLSIREGLQAEMGSVRATLEELQHLLATQVQLDPSFPPFLRKKQAQGVPVILLSGGFDLCVETVLEKVGLWPLPYLSNRLVGSPSPKGDRTPLWKVEFPYPSSTCSACGTCKGDSIRTWNAQGYTTVFVGNGVTDRCAALTANLTFAKDELAQWCRSQKIEAAPFANFGDVEKELRRRDWA